MSTEIDATIAITSWDEKPFDERPQADRLTTTTVTKDYTGAITGSSVTESLMAYAPDGTATFMGIERITGTVGGSDGTLVLQHLGRYEGGVATASVTILSGNGGAGERYWHRHVRCRPRTLTEPDHGPSYVLRKVAASSRSSTSAWSRPSMTPASTSPRNNGSPASASARRRLEMAQQRMYGGRPRSGGAAHRPIDERGAARVAPGQPYLVRRVLLR